MNIVDLNKLNKTDISAIDPLFIQDVSKSETKLLLSFDLSKYIVSSSNLIVSLKSGSFTGSFYGLPTKLVPQFQELYHSCIDELYSLGISDDDQHVLLRCYCKNPSLFQLYLSENKWPEGLNYFQKNALDKNKEQIKKKSNNDENVSYLPFYLILNFILYAFIAHYIDKYLNKNQERLKKSRYLIMLNHIVGLIFLNIVGIISISGFVAVNFVWYLEAFLLVSFLLYLFATYSHFRIGYSNLKENNHQILSSLETKLFYYPNFIVPSLFLIIIIFFNFR